MPAAGHIQNKVMQPLTNICADAPKGSGIILLPPGYGGVSTTAKAVGKTPAGSKNDEAALSVRTPEELFNMAFDPEDLYLDNGVLAAEQSCTILGTGGIGKSRLLLQLAVCTIIGREFLGWKVTKRRLRWLIIQVENSNRCLQDDLKAMRPWIGEELWPLVNQSLVIHTLEKDHDTFLNVSEHASAELLARLINQYEADVVAFDPLYAFATGNLNTDAAMHKTCKAITDLARRGNPKRAIVVLHHALTGKEGFGKWKTHSQLLGDRGAARHLNQSIVLFMPCRLDLTESPLPARLIPTSRCGRRQAAALSNMLALER
jgi:hypothetical protein